MRHPVRTTGWVSVLLVTTFFVFVYASLVTLTDETA